MHLENRISAFISLGRQLRNADLSELAHKANTRNNWFTQDNVRFALESIAEEMLQESHIREWLSRYDALEEAGHQVVALILAGNIPAVGFHDVVSVLILGLRAQIKLSSKDTILIPFLLDELVKIEPQFNELIEYVDRVADFDAIIATGSDNSGSYFEHYFKKYPHIIRKNRKSIGIIDLHTSDDDIRLMGEDVFRYFGLGCRNISKVYVHAAVDLTRIMELWHEQKELILHNKYKNNYDYNYTVYLLNQENFLMNGALLLREHESLHSRIACLHYERFEMITDVIDAIREQHDSLQCVVYHDYTRIEGAIRPGATQRPKLWEYADNVDVIDFLKKLR